MPKKCGSFYTIYAYVTRYTIFFIGVSFILDKHSSFEIFHGKRNIFTYSINTVIITMKKGQQVFLSLGINHFFKSNITEERSFQPSNTMYIYIYRCICVGVSVSVFVCV